MNLFFSFPHKTIDGNQTELIDMLFSVFDVNKSNVSSSTELIC